MLSIGEFSKISKITTKTLRYYDDIGLLRPLKVSPVSGYRYYAAEQLRTVLLITKLKAYGCSLEEIAGVLTRPEDQTFLAALLQKKEQAMTEQLEEYRVLLGQLRQDAANLERGISIMSYLDQIPVKLVSTKDQTVLFIREKMDVSQYGNYIGKLYETIAREKLEVLGPPMSVFHDSEHNPESYDMEIAVPVRQAVKGTRDFPGCLCAMATLKGSYQGLPSVYATLKKFTEDEGYELQSAPFEVYLTNPGTTPVDEFLTEVYLPVKKI